MQPYEDSSDFLVSLSVTLPVSRYCAPRINSVKTISGTNELPVEVESSVSHQRLSKYSSEYFSAG